MVPPAAQQTALQSTVSHRRLRGWGTQRQKSRKRSPTLVQYHGFWGSCAGKWCCRCFRYRPAATEALTALTWPRHLH